MSIFARFIIPSYCLCKANHLLLSNGSLNEWNPVKTQTKHDGTAEQIPNELNDAKISYTCSFGLF